MNYENINLTKSMYTNSSKSFSQLLEELDPSSEYAGTELEGMDAYQRQLKRFDIKVCGKDSDMVQKFFAASESSVLFPEYVRRAVKQGMSEIVNVEDIAAAVTVIPGIDYRSINASISSTISTEIAENGTISSSPVTTKSSLVDLKKYGSMLVASYESLKFQRIDIFTVALKRIGAGIAMQQLNDAVSIIKSGDTGSNSAGVVNVTTANTVTYDDILTVWAALQPYEMNTMIVSKDVMQLLLAIEEFKNPLTGLNFQGTGKLSTPLGAKLICSNSLPEKTFIALDKNYSLEMVVSSDVSVEYDKLIDCQTERTAITSTVGFSKIFADASKVLSLATA